MSKTGRVIQSTGSWYEVAGETEGDEIVNCRLPGRFRQKEMTTTNPIAVGDIVTYTLNDDGTGSIAEIHDRKNYLIRASTKSKQGEQILAANVDGAYVVQAIRRPNLKEGFIDRFLVTCEAYQISASVIVNKSDLATADDLDYLEELKGVYEPLGYPMYLTTIKKTESLDSLRKNLENRTSVLIGPSGTGKTSLMNVMDPTLQRKVGEISDYNEKGKHTTTFAKLLPLTFGGYLVDTPGIREFGLVNIEPWELSLFFPEMLEPRRQCKFNNCTHSHEPGCGVVEAFEQGDIYAGRYQSYLQMLDSIAKN